jgi:hypothetical protein
MVSIGERKNQGPSLLYDTKVITMLTEALTPALIYDSWYTSMLGKRASVDTVITYLKEKKVANCTLTVMNRRLSFWASHLTLNSPHPLDSQLHADYISARSHQSLGHRLVAWKHACITGISNRLVRSCLCEGLSLCS